MQHCSDIFEEMYKRQLYTLPVILIVNCWLRLHLMSFCHTNDENKISFSVVQKTEMCKNKNRNKRQDKTLQHCKQNEVGPYDLRYR